MMKYKFILSAIIALFICGKSSINAQTPTERGKFEVSIYENFLHGTYDLMSYTGANFGYYFTDNLKVSFDYAGGKSLVGKYNKAQLASLQFGVCSPVKDRFSLYAGLGPGLLRDLQVDEKYKNKAGGVLNVQPRINVGNKSFLAFDFKAVLGKDLKQGSLVGVSWGVRF